VLTTKGATPRLAGHRVSRATDSGGTALLWGELLDHLCFLSVRRVMCNFFTSTGCRQLYVLIPLPPFIFLSLLSGAGIMKYDVINQRATRFSDVCFFFICHLPQFVIFCACEAGLLGKGIG